MFRAEAMDDDVFWMCCYFRNGERITWNVTVGSKPKRIVMSTVEMPGEWIDIDKRGDNRIWGIDG
jgi:hypothetical protein